MINTEIISVQIELTEVNRLCCECKNAPPNSMFSFYILKNGKPLDKLPYQKESRYIYWLTEPGIYSVKVFILNDSEKVSVISQKVSFEGGKPIYCNVTPPKRKLNWIKNVSGVMREIWIHRKRMFRISLYDYKVLNKDAYLGNVWNFLNPLIQIATYWFVFGIGIRAGKPVEGHPYIVWMLCGMIPWFFVSACITHGANAIREKGITVLKMRYPIATTPLEQVFVQFYSHLIMVSILMVSLVCMGYRPTFYWFNLIYYFIYALVFYTALSMITSVLTMIALDFQKLINSLLRLLFYVTPILWSIEKMPTLAQQILRMNPVLYYVNGFRDSLLFNIPFYEYPKSIAFFWGINIVLLLVGCNLLTKYKDQFIDLQ